MKKSILTLCATLSVTAVLAAPAEAPRLAPNGKPIAKKIDKATVERIQMKQFGGFLFDVREQKGKIVIVNAQKAADPAWFDEIVVSFDKMVKLAMEVAPGTFDLAAPKLQGTVSVFVVDDPKLPMSLIAPESKWAMVNVAPLKTEKAPFFKARVQKATTRALAFVLGAADSQYPNCVTGCVTKPEDLDQFVHATMLPVDIVKKMNKNAPGLGLVPYKKTTYKNACQEGWAHQPTNEFQKAIWDKVHTIPKNPMKIEFDPKKGR